MGPELLQRMQVSTHLGFLVAFPEQCRVMLFLTTAMKRNHFLPTWLCKAPSVVIPLGVVHARGVTIQNPFDVHLLPKEFVTGASSLVSWTPTAEGTVSLKLFAGASRDMQYVSTIAHFIENKGSFAWTPSIALDASDDYALLIVSDADDQLIDCSPPFTIKRPIIDRQEAQSSFMSDFGPVTTDTIPQASTTREVVTLTAATPTPATTNPVSPSSVTDSSPTNAQTTVAATTSEPPNPATSSQSAAQPSSSSGLSTGAAIGIGVGATLLMLLLIALLAFFLVRHRRQKRRSVSAPGATSSGPAELETGKSGVQKAIDLGTGGGWEADKKSELEGGIAKPQIAELGSPPPLSPDEYAELERRRRAVELQGQSIGVAGVAELQGQTHPRAELEALRANSRNVHELGGQAILSEVQPAYHR